MRAPVCVLALFLGCASEPVDVEVRDLLVQPGTAATPVPVLGGDAVDVDFTFGEGDYANNIVASYTATTLTIGDDVLTIDLKTGKVTTTGTLDDGARAFWRAVATAYPEVKREMCGGGQ